MNDEVSAYRNYSIGKVIRIILAVAVVLFLVALFIYSASSSSKTNVHTASSPWNKNMVLGSLDAPNKMVEYTDYFCSFCEELHEAMTDQFKEEYIDTGKLSFETRIVNILNGVSVNTDKGNEAAFCAADQNKYWEYSDKIINNINTDFFSKGIGVKNVANPVKIQKLDDSYFIAPAKEVAMDVDEFTSCLSENKHKATIEANSEKAIQMGVTGLPNISVNNYQASGFGGGGYDELKLILKAGGVN